ncbi:MAG: nonribosomal peptide synthetase MxaA [Methylocella sp.]
MKPSHAGLFFLLAASPAMAEGASVEILKPRLFGYFIGDVIADDVLITPGPGFVLKASSLPALGTLNYWLNLKSITAKEDKGQDGKTRYHLKLTYQTFYDPLEPHWLKIPSFQLIFDNADQTASVDVPEWSFLSSPIREVSPTESRGNTFIQPDVPPFEKQLGKAWHWLYGTSIAVLISYLVLAYSRAWVPFRLYPERPFTSTARLLRRLTRKTAGEDSYRQALILLHLAFNTTGRRAVLADDLPDFLSLYPRFQMAEADISKFLAASRRTFFGHDCIGAMRDFSIVELVSLSQRLSAAERGLQ